MDSRHNGPAKTKLLRGAARNYSFRPEIPCASAAQAIIDPANGVLRIDKLGLTGFELLETFRDLGFPGLRAFMATKTKMVDIEPTMV